MLPPMHKNARDMVDSSKLQSDVALQWTMMSDRGGGCPKVTSVPPVSSPARAWNATLWMNSTHASHSLKPRSNASGPTAASLRLTWLPLKPCSGQNRHDGRALPRKSRKPSYIGSNSRFGFAFFRPSGQTPPGDRHLPKERRLDAQFRAKPREDSALGAVSRV